VKIDIQTEAMMSGKKGRSGRKKTITDDELRALDACWRLGGSMAAAARRIGLSPKRAHNAHYKLRMRRAMYGASIDSPRTIQW